MIHRRQTHTVDEVKRGQTFDQSPRERTLSKVNFERVRNPYRVERRRYPISIHRERERERENNGTLFGEKGKRLNLLKCFRQQFHIGETIAIAIVQINLRKKKLVFHNKTCQVKDNFNPFLCFDK